LNQASDGITLFVIVARDLSLGHSYRDSINMIVRT